jgi:hypothetical protein
MGHSWERSGIQSEQSLIADASSTTQVREHQGEISKRHGSRQRRHSPPWIRPRDTLDLPEDANSAVSIPVLSSKAARFSADCL